MECHQMTGSVKKVVVDRGFGFIAAEDGAEYFFHRSGLDSSTSFENLAVGEHVTFAVENSDKGPRARDVRTA
jgi:cold shock protein